MFGIHDGDGFRKILGSALCAFSLHKMEVSLWLLWRKLCSGLVSLCGRKWPIVLIQSPVKPAVRCYTKTQWWTNRARRLFSAVNFPSFAGFSPEFSPDILGQMHPLFYLPLSLGCQLPSHTWILGEQYVALKRCISQRLLYGLLIWHANVTGHPAFLLATAAEPLIVTGEAALLTHFPGKELFPLLYK